MGSEPVARHRIPLKMTQPYTKLTDEHRKVIFP